MGILGGVVGGGIGGAIGAIIWAGIYYFTNYEAGYVAWGVGGLVGFGFAKGNDTPGAAAGVIASIIAVLALLGGKVLIAQAIMIQEIPSQTEAIDGAIASLEDEEVVISWVADDIIVDMEEDGEPVDWPAGIDPDNVYAESDYPKNVWKKATTEWASMSSEHRKEYRSLVQERIRLNYEDYGEYRAEVRSYVFKESFGLLDIVFFLLAIGTAFKMAGDGLEEE